MRVCVLNCGSNMDNTNGTHTNKRITWKKKWILTEWSDLIFVNTEIQTSHQNKNISTNCTFQSNIFCLSYFSWASLETDDNIKSYVTTCVNILGLQWVNVCWVTFPGFRCYDAGSPFSANSDLHFSPDLKICWYFGCTVCFSLCHMTYFLTISSPFLDHH